MKKNIAFIFARKNSKGLPGKNIIDFNGIPLIAHTINFAKKINLFDDIVVSTDSNTIAEIALEYGATVPFIRPEHLATDESPEIYSWRHAINFYLENISNFYTFVSLPTTSPLRSKEDLFNGFNLFNTKNFDLVLSVSESNQNPYFNMVKKENNFVKILLNNKKYYRRQDCPKIFNISTAFYISSWHYILNCENIFDGNIGAVDLPKHRSVDIDDLFDFSIAKFINNNISLFE